MNAANIYINNGMLDLNGYILTVSGDVCLGSGTLNVNKGKLYVGGDLNLRYSDRNYGNGYLNMQNDDYTIKDNYQAEVKRIPPLSRDDVVELYSQLGYRFIQNGWHVGELDESLRIKKTAIFLSYSPNYGAGLYGLGQGMMYHTGILNSQEMKKTVINFILD